MKNIIRDLLLITLASILYGSAIALFLEPNHLAPGGLSGVSILLSHALGGNSGTWYLCLNVPLIILGLWKFGFRFMGRTAYAILLMSVQIHFFTPYGPVTTDRFLASAAGAILLAAGIGLCFRAHSTSGGIDILIKVLRTHFRHMKTGSLFQCFDFIVVTLSAFLFRDIEVALYALFAVFLCGRAINLILYGSDEARMIYIITERPDAIGPRLLHDLDTCYTHLDGQGGYTGRGKHVLLCVVPKKLGPAVQEVVKREDPEAFMILTDASEIYGLGYKDFFGEEL